MKIEAEHSCPRVHKVKVKSLSCVRLSAPMDSTHQALRPWDFPGKSTGVGCHCLLRGYIGYIKSSYFNYFVIYCTMKLLYNLINSIVFSNTLFQH